MKSSCELLHELVRQLPRYNTSFDPARLPSNGVYFVFEKGETSHDGERIVRVGTHTGENNLRKRVQEHFLKENKNRSIFRKHLGKCILHRDDLPEKKRTQWDWDLTSRSQREAHAGEIDFEWEKTIERKVTAYIRDNICSAVISVDSKQERLAYERALIGTLCRCEACKLSSGWLGRSHPNRKISETGVWNILCQNEASISQSEVEKLFSKRGINLNHF